MESKLAKRLLCAGLASVLLLVLLIGPLAVTDSSAGQATDAVTVTSVDQDKGLVTVRDHGTGATKQIKIDNVEALKSFKVGEVLEKPASLEVQSRAAQSPPTRSGNQDKKVAVLNGVWPHLALATASVHIGVRPVDHA